MVTSVVVTLLPSVHRTTEQGNRLFVLFAGPLTVSVNAGPPTAALVGESEVIAGGSKVLGAVMVNVAEFEVVVELDTVMAAVPEKAVSAAVIAAVSCVELTKVLTRGEPFQFTTSPFTKPAPFTVSVRPVGAQKCVDVGEIDEMAGATIENEIAFEVPPPGAGLNTVTGIDATEAMSAAEIVA